MKRYTMLILFLIFFPWMNGFAVENLSIDQGISPKDGKKMVHVIEAYMKSWNENHARGFTKDFGKKSNLVTNRGECYIGKKSIQDYYNHMNDTFLHNSIFRVEGLQLLLVAKGIVMGYVNYEVDSAPRVFEEEKMPGFVYKGMLTHVFKEKDGKWEIISTQNTIDEMY
ncbi:MAG: hypothetical protein SP4CHLAM5_03990 [Chlamydiia bacterium]|nr:hypothetical protein [Chlamydiia bacterium]MCH9618272.1 hypothetical protein [Chlamydiia bacterium]MCH9624760.1 hypothetical protein [Chlamydiia bacterium]